VFDVPKKKTSAKKTEAKETISINISKSIVNALDDFQFNNRIRSRSQAAEQLLTSALLMHDLLIENDPDKNKIHNQIHWAKMELNRILFHLDRKEYDKVHYVLDFLTKRIEYLEQELKIIIERKDN
jgi:metal-responsive CopG/Arc/MetJ family transcriptional regulator